MTDEQIVYITELVFRNWSDKASSLLIVRGERNDGSPDWSKFHDQRLENAEHAERQARDARDAWQMENREALRRQMGT